MLLDIVIAETIFIRRKNNHLHKISVAANAEQIALCGTNKSANPTSAIVLALDFSGKIKWYNSFETTTEGRDFGNSRCRGVAYDDN